MSFDGGSIFSSLAAMKKWRKKLMEINERFETRQQQQANKKRNKKETEQDCTFRIIVHDWSSVHQSTRHRNRRFIPIDGCIGTEMELADAIINLTPTSTVEHLGASRSISEHLGEGQESTGAVRHQRRAADAGGKRGGERAPGAISGPVRESPPAWNPPISHQLL